MNNFWEMSDGQNAATGDKEYEAPSGNLDPIPDDSSVRAHIDEARWADTKDNYEYLSLRWRVDEPEEYANRVIFQKLWISDDDPNAKSADAAAKKRDRAKRMLATIDANCGGKLARKATRPTDDDLALALSNKPMTIKLKVWEMSGQNGEVNSGNWVCAVSPASKGVDVKPASARPASGNGGGNGGGRTRPPADDLGDDEIPF